MKTEEEIKKACELIHEKIKDIVETDNPDLSINEHTEIVTRLAKLIGKLEMLLWVIK